MPYCITLLVLEDNPQVLAALLKRMTVIEKEKGLSINIVQFPTLHQAQEYLEKNPYISFDVILLDKNDAEGESFHQLPLEKLGVEKIISISSVPRANEEAKARGVTHVVLKDYDNLDAFADEVIRHVREMLGFADIV